MYNVTPLSLSFYYDFSMLHFGLALVGIRVELFLVVVEGRLKVNNA